MPLGRKREYLSADRWVGCLLVMLCAVIGCTEEKGDRFQKSQRISESFEFFDVGVNTLFGKTLREDLKRQLGSDGIAYMDPLDLTVNYKGFLQAHFPDLYRLHRQLNPVEGVRREHNTINLVYRYAQRNNLPFKYVQLVFSNDTGKPLLFKIRATKEAEYLITRLREEYGVSDPVDWKGTGASAVFWQKNGDTLILTTRINIYGNPEYDIFIYFARNIEEVLAIEKRAVTQAEQDRQKAGKSAF